MKANNDMRFMPIGKGPKGWKILKVSGRPPCPRYFMSMEHFEQSNMIIIFGGRTESEINQDNFSLNDVFLMSLKHPQWYHLNCKGIST